MPDPVYALGENDMRRVARATRSSERAVQGRPPRPAMYPRSPILPVMHLVTGSGGIPARSGDVMGIADCHVRDITSSDGRTLETTERTMPVRNRAASPVGANKEIMADWDTHGLVCVWEECDE